MFGHTIIMASATAFAIICLSSSSSHMRKHIVFKDTLHSHGVIPHPAVSILAAGVVLAELSLGTLAVISLTFNPIPNSGLWVVGVFAGMLFVVYAFYLESVSRSNDNSPKSCGCGVGEIDLGSETVVRAVMSGVLGVLGFWGMASMKTSIPVVSGDFALVALIGLSLANFVTWLPVMLWSRKILVEVVSP